MLVVYGGAFDPPHRGHDALLRAAIDFARRDGAAGRVIVAPSAARVAHKTASLTPIEQRLRWVRDWSAQYTGDGVEVFDGQARGWIASTSDVLLDQFDDPDRWLLIGEDQLSAFRFWLAPGRILSLAGLLVASRGGLERDRAAEDWVVAQGGRIARLEVEGGPIAMSSSDLRACLSRGEDVSAQLAPGARTPARYARNSAQLMLEVALALQPDLRDGNGIRAHDRHVELVDGTQLSVGYGEAVSLTHPDTGVGQFVVGLDGRTTGPTILPGSGDPSNLSIVEGWVVKLEDAGYDCRASCLNLAAGRGKVEMLRALLELLGGTVPSGGESGLITTSLPGCGPVAGRVEDRGVHLAFAACGGFELVVCRSRDVSRLTVLLEPGRITDDARTMLIEVLLPALEDLGVRTDTAFALLP